MKLTVPLPTGDVTIQPGDVIDLGANGVLTWLADEDAQAWRLMQRKRQREVRAVIDHVKRSQGEAKGR